MIHDYWHWHISLLNFQHYIHSLTTHSVLHKQVTIHIPHLTNDGLYYPSTSVAYPSRTPWREVAYSMTRTGNMWDASKCIVFLYCQRARKLIANKFILLDIYFIFWFKFILYLCSSLDIWEFSKVSCVLWVIIH